MPAPKPRPTRESLENQDHSIKARKSELFDAPEAAGGVPAARPFREYLRETPAAPLSAGWKAALWASAVVVGLLLIASLLKGRSPRTGPDPDPAAGAGAAAGQD